MQVMPALDEVASRVLGATIRSRSLRSSPVMSDDEPAALINLIAG